MADKKSKTKDPYISRNEFKKGFYEQADKPAITSDTMYGTDRNIIQGEMNNVDQLGNVISANSGYTMGGLTEQPHLGYIPRTKGGSILSKENISKGKNGANTVIKTFGHEGAIDPKKAQITKLLSKGGSILAKGNKLAKHKPTKLY